MFEMQFLRSYINDRLTLAAEDIFGAVQRSVKAEYEKEVNRLREETAYLLNSYLEAHHHGHGTLQRLITDPPQQLPVSIYEDGIPPVQQYCDKGTGTCPHQDQSELPQIKEEEDKLWVSQTEQHHQGQEKDDANNSILNASCMLNIQAQNQTYLHQTQRVENGRESLLHNTSAEQMRSGPDEGGFGVFEPTRVSKPSSLGCRIAESENGNDMRESRGPQLGFNAQTSKEEPCCYTAYQELFSSRPPLLNPMSTHTTEYPFRCSVCCEVFTENASLLLHVKTHTVDKSFTCSVCGRGFSRKRYVRSHMRTHTGEKPYVCHFCNKSFTQSSSLNTHLRIHTGETPYSCGVCGRTFRIKDSLRRHMWTHEKIEAHLHEGNQVNIFPYVPPHIPRENQHCEQGRNPSRGVEDLTWPPRIKEEPEPPWANDEGELITRPSHLNLTETMGNRGDESLPNTSTLHKPGEATSQ